MITFTPLSGAAHFSRTIPLAYLLKVDDVQILLDCGSPDWCPERPSSSAVKQEDIEESSYHWERYCDALRECAPSIDLVLLSHGDLAHTGLYPYAYTHWGLRAPAYTTLPVQAMARIAATEDIEGVREEEDVGDDSPSESDHSLPPEDTGVLSDPSPQPEDAQETKKPKSGKYVATLQEVHDAFDTINVLRYSQPCHLQGKCQGLTIIPFNAGHTLGGTIWKIRSPTAGTLLYAVDINHMRERHLDGTVLMRHAGSLGGGSGVFESLQRPDLLITDADRANVTTATRKDRDAALLDCVSATLIARNSILMPCDSSTRVLELLVLLDQHWSFSRLKYPICLLSRTGREMLTFVRSMMEWLGGTISKEDVGPGGAQGGKSSKGSKRKRDDDNDEEALGALALRFRHLEFFNNPAALLQSYSSKEPKLILAVPASLSHGHSRALFADFAEVIGNVILLTGRGEEGTLGRLLFERWNDSQREEAKWDRGKIGSNVMLEGTMVVQMNSKVPLQGTELEIFLQKEQAAKEKAAAQKAAMERNQRVLEADEDGSESESDSDSDSEDEDEVERTLGDNDVTDLDGMDGVEDSKPRKKGSKRRRGSGTDWGGLAMDVDDGLTKHILSFDIYLKGNVSKFFKTAEGQSQRFRMFPYVEKRRKVDEYGEILDVERWRRKGQALEEDTESEEIKEMKRLKAEEEANNAPQEPPSKFVTTEREVQLACRLLFVDLEGLNNGRAVKTIVPQINPRKMIIIHAPSAATDALVESCAGIRAMTKDVYTPRQGESVQIGQHTNSFSISLTDELLNSVKMSRFEDNEVGFITGRIASLATSTVPVLEPYSSAKGPSRRPSLSGPRAGQALGSRPRATLPQSTMIGELKLTALKARLAAVGVQAELVGEGVLLCGAAAKRGNSSDALEDSVSVKKTARGKVELEGAVSGVYYIVRREIYNLHALVAA